MAYLDFKVTRWRRIYVPDDKVDETIKKLREAASDGPYDLVDEGTDYFFKQDLGVDEIAEEAMTIEENSNNATQEIYSEDGVLLYSNLPNSVDWICTDPDNDQWGRKLGDGHYEFKESNPAFEINPVENEEYVQMDILIDQYSSPVIEGIVGSYYSSLANLKEQNGDNWEWVLAECIFEFETGFY